MSKKKELVEFIGFLVADFLKRSHHDPFEIGWISGQLSFCHASGILSEEEWLTYFDLVSDATK